MIWPHHAEGLRAAAPKAFGTAQIECISEGVMAKDRHLSSESPSNKAREGVLHAMYVGFTCLPHISMMPGCCLPKS